MTSCSRAACADRVAGLIRLHRADRVAALLPLADATFEPDEFGLCAYHLTRVRAPQGWSVVNRVPVSALSEHPEPPPRRPDWVPSRQSRVDDVSLLRTAASRLLRRAFRGVTPDDDQVQGQLRMPF